nr:MAG TPA: hypothetical protein [Caudoviricetes sp.]
MIHMYALRSHSNARPKFLESILPLFGMERKYFIEHLFVFIFLIICFYIYRQLECWELLEIHGIVPDVGHYLNSDSKRSVI